MLAGPNAAGAAGSSGSNGTGINIGFASSVDSSVDYSVRLLYCAAVLAYLPMLLL